MKGSVAATLLALGAVVSAVPAAAPAKFAIQINATIDGKLTSLYLGKDGQGGGVTDLKKAESCSINANTQLVCGGKTIGAAPTAGYVDMAPLAPVSGAAAITDGYSIDANNVLHWKSSKFASLPEVGSIIMKDQGGEAQWGLFKSLLLTGNSLKLYSQLGCPGGSHGGLHDVLITGTNRVIPL